MSPQGGRPASDGCPPVPCSARCSSLTGSEWLCWRTPMETLSLSPQMLTDLGAPLPSSLAAGCVCSRPQAAFAQGGLSLFLTFGSLPGTWI